MSEPDEAAPLRRGWTTGACAAGAARAAFEALITGACPETVPVALPKGLRPEFAIATHEVGEGFARAGIVKDAGDDPDVTHGATIVAVVRRNPPGVGVTFRAGEGVGTVTRPGLPLAVGEPAINPAPRQMIRDNLAEAAARFGVPADVDVEIAIPGGAKIAERTANGRLGILGGLSILGTTGVVVPYSCSAWIHSIHRGVDVARASGCRHIGAATGDVSEQALNRLYRLPDHALIEMGDFVGGLIKYLRAHPVARVTIAGGVAKMSKLAEGKLDLHSRRGAVDLAALGARVAAAGGELKIVDAIGAANSALHAFEIAAAAGVDLAALVAKAAWGAAARAFAGAETELEIIVVSRDGAILAREGFAPVHVSHPAAGRLRNRRT